MAWGAICNICRLPLEGGRCPVCQKLTIHPSGHDNPKVAAVIAVLQDWFEAIEDGTAGSRYPDSQYERRGGRPGWTDAEVNKAINVLDYEFQYERSQRPSYWAERGFTSDPDFDRLAPPQRLAMIQQIDNALRTPALPKNP